jgi:hypothetical protein
LVTVNLGKTKALIAAVNGRSPALMKWKRQAAEAYRSQIFNRFNRFSRGGGDWKQTARSRANSTVKRKGRKIKGADGRLRNAFILRKTHTLFKAWSPVWRNLPGQYQRITEDSVEVGVKGGRHPEAPFSVGRLASIHNFGEGNMPKRQMMVKPNKATTDLMIKRLDKLLKGSL